MEEVEEDVWWGLKVILFVKGANATLTMRPQLRTWSFSLDTRTVTPTPPPTSSCRFLTRHIEQTRRSARAGCLSCSARSFVNVSCCWYQNQCPPRMLSIPFFLDVNVSQHILFHCNRRSCKPQAYVPVAFPYVPASQSVQAVAPAKLRTGHLNADGAAVAVCKRRRL